VPSSNKTRLMIGKWLKEPELHFPPQERDVKEVGVCVGQIQLKSTALTQSTISILFLSVLQENRIDRVYPDRQWTYYKEMRQPALNLNN